MQTAIDVSDERVFVKQNGNHNQIDIHRRFETERKALRLSAGEARSIRLVAK